MKSKLKEEMKEYLDEKINNLNLTINKLSDRCRNLMTIVKYGDGMSIDSGNLTKVDPFSGKLGSDPLFSYEKSFTLICNNKEFMTSKLYPFTINSYDRYVNILGYIKVSNIIKIYAEIEKSIIGVLNGDEHDITVAEIIINTDDSHVVNTEVKFTSQEFKSFTNKLNKFN